MTICDYLKIDEVKRDRTKEESLRLFAEYPSKSDFMRMYSFMIDDDAYIWPRDWIDEKLHEQCMFFNHSCDANCGFKGENGSQVVAIRDIEPGEELCCDYQCMGTEAGFFDGLKCLCGSFKCRGTLRFDEYRNIDWQNTFYKYSCTYVKRKIDELKTKWYSSRCYLKYYEDRVLIFFIHTIN